MNGFSGSSPLTARIVPSPNFGPRRGARGVDMLVLHYTGCPSAESALLWMCSPQSQVSAHYLVDADGEIVQLVDEDARAWHAGASCWGGERDVNSCSIGVEIQNRGHLDDPPEPYPPAQVAAVMALAEDIMRRRAIPPARVVGHSDIAPARKADPGEHFPWEELAREGVGVWVPPAPLESGGAAPAEMSAAGWRRMLAAVGYDVGEGDVFDLRLALVLRAFQRHWRPARAGGEADRSTADTLRRLLAALDPSA